jgi:thiamine pyrophosphokinase
MRVLILANGEPPSPTLLRGLAAEHDLLIAVDGAVRFAAQSDITPDIISGDFDSVSLAEARRFFPEAECVATPDQNRADLEKAILLAQSRGATAITLTGATGRRLDHTLGSLVLLLRYGAEVPLSLVEDGTVIRAVSRRWQFPTQPGDTISLISPEGRARVTLLGVQWPLQDERLSVGTQGISNVAVGREVTVEVTGGTILVCHLDKHCVTEV